MCTATSAYLQMSEDTMHKYVTGPTTLKTMMSMLHDELDRGSKSVYPDATKARVRFQKDVTMEYANTIVGYQAWHQFATNDHHKDVDELDFP